MAKKWTKLRQVILTTQSYYKLRRTYPGVSYLDSELEEPTTMPLQASFTWEDSLNMYKLKFENLGPRYTWTQLKSITDLIKGTIPAGTHRDYDPVNKEWFISQDYEIIVKGYLDATLGEKNVFFFQKPENTGVNSTNKLSVEDELKIFSSHVGLSVDELAKLDKAKATKVYRQAALKYHPDRNPSNGPIMSEINMVWNSLKEGYYLK